MERIEVGAKEREMLQSALGTGEGAFLSQRWLQVSGISEVIVSSAEAALFGLPGAFFLLVQEWKLKGLGPVPS